MIKINLLKEIENSKAKELEPKEEVLTPIQPKPEIVQEPTEIEQQQTEPELVAEAEAIETADNFDDVEEKETLIDAESPSEEIEVKNAETELEEVEEKRSPFRPIKFDTSVPEKVEDEPEEEKIELIANEQKDEEIKDEDSEQKETESEETHIEMEEETKKEKSLEKSEQVEDENEKTEENDDESVIVDDAKPAVPFRVVESSIEEDDDDIEFTEFTDSKMPHILVTIAILAVIGASGYYLWTINDDLVDQSVADKVPSEEYQEEMPSESVSISEEIKDDEITEIPQEEFKFDESASSKIEEPISAKPKPTSTTTETKKEEKLPKTPPVTKEAKETPEPAFTTTGNVNFNKVTIPNALILKRDVSAGEFKITCFSQKKFTREVVAEFKKRGGYSQLNINVRTDIRDGKIGDLIIFTGKN
ncbi:MAG: hypothetical protein DWQ06_09940 [Calditrichaeota bacterium]|nr:MAG: hypothetical protein DWQ06_09940 [Calditrichota bacterium]